MKTKESMTNIKKRYPVTVSAFYCDLQNIMKHNEPTYYNAGLYGWNCDIYTDYVDGEFVAISTGYRNTRGPVIPRSLIAEYNDRAEMLANKYRGRIGADAYNAEKDAYYSLQYEFFKAVRAWYYSK